MRWVALFLTVFVCAPMAAQEDPVPDTLDYRLYYPLEVGNVWEYKVIIFPGETYYLRREVIRDTTIQGRLYFAEQRWESHFEEPWIPSGQSLLRYDDATTRLYRWSGPSQVDVIHTCPLGADFGSTVDCFEIGQKEETVYGGYGGSVLFDTGPVPVAATKTFAGIADPPGIPLYASGIGDYFLQLDIGSSKRKIEYARIAGVEYGVPIPVRTESDSPELTSGPSSIDVAPNPFTSEVRLRVRYAIPQQLDIEVFDIVGRRVYAGEEFVGVGRTELNLDGSDWPRGVYFVRVCTTAGQSATTHITRL